MTAEELASLDLELVLEVLIEELLIECDDAVELLIEMLDRPTRH